MSDATADADAGRASPPTATDGALGLVVSLCRALEQEEIRYCHWKSNEAIARSASGENDLDLLIARDDGDRFGEVLHRLGFKPARPPASREVPGLIDHYGLDPSSGLLVHLQAHYQLVLGDDMTKNFRLPVEREYLASAPSGPLIRVPAPAFELAVFVVRMILKHASWDAQLCLFGKLSTSEQRELGHLLGQVPEPGRAAAVAERLPFLSPELVERGLAVLLSEPAPWTRASVARTLEQALVAHARRPRRSDIPLRTVRRALRAARHVLGNKVRKSLVAGGALIAVNGPDPATTTSVVEALVSWLGKDFAARAFPFTDGSDAAASWSTYGRARRHATNGGIAICGQFPTSAPGRAAGRGEDIRSPDVLVLLDEPARRDRSGVPVCSVDSDRPFDELVLEVRRQVWARL